MFQSKTAWFSNSVRQKYINFWISEGGTVACWRTADYLFSEDATCPDTVGIFDSKDFLWNKLTVFHSMFLSTCDMRQSVMSVCIGHYVLPPASVQDEVRNIVGRLIWECEDEQSPAHDSQDNSHFSKGNESSEEEWIRTQSERRDTVSSDSDILPCDNSLKYSTGSFLQGYIHMDNLQKYAGPLTDFHPSYFRCSQCKVLRCSSHQTEGKTIVLRHR